MCEEGDVTPAEEGVRRPGCYGACPLFNLLDLIVHHHILILLSLLGWAVILPLAVPLVSPDSEVCDTH